MAMITTMTMTDDSDDDFEHESDFSGFEDGGRKRFLGCFSGSWGEGCWT
jgi:hypothetical protein